MASFLLGSFRVGSRPARPVTCPAQNMDASPMPGWPGGGFDPDFLRRLRLQKHGRFFRQKVAPSSLARRKGAILPPARTGRQQLPAQTTVHPEGGDPCRRACLAPVCGDHVFHLSLAPLNHPRSRRCAGSGRLVPTPACAPLHCPFHRASSARIEVNPPPFRNRENRLPMRHRDANQPARSKGMLTLLLIFHDHRRVEVFDLRFDLKTLADHGSHALVHERARGGFIVP